MADNTLIEKYNTQKQKIKVARLALETAEENIVFQCVYGVGKEFIVRPQDKCVAQYTEISLEYNKILEYAHQVSMKTTEEHCDEIKNGKVCKKTNCPGFCNYTEYQDAKKNYNAEVKKLREYPWWVKIAVIFKKNENSK